MQMNNVDHGAKEKHEKSRKKRKHMRMLEKLEKASLTASCCYICHCDCYNSHRSMLTDCTEIEPSMHKKSTTTKRRSRKSSVSKSTKPNSLHSNSKSMASHIDSNMKRSKSTTDLNLHHSRHDCEILEDLLSLHQMRTPRLVVTNATPHTIRENNAIADNSMKDKNSDLTTLCESLAQLCLEPSVHEAYKQVPTKDQRILNRMAAKRSERVVAKENAWLARKYWENERLESDLLKCNQMKEYKRAICEKQFQDYLITRARLQRIAQRDNQQLQHLRATLAIKDQRANERLTALRIERSLSLCQRRCKELRKTEVVNLHQEELLLDEAYRKQHECQRLVERLKRADYIRSYLLTAQLRRLKYDNELEQLLHEEHWRQTQENEQRKREQLTDHIHQKSSRTQKFVESRQRRNMAATQTAKISASLRELVRSSLAVNDVPMTATPGLGSIGTI